MGDPGLVDLAHPHTEAVAALLGATNYPTYVAEVTGDDATRVYPYLVLWPFPGSVAWADLGCTPTEYLFRFQVTAVGRDRRETLAALDRARAELVAVSPTITGRNCGLISQDDGENLPVSTDPAVRDPATGRPVFFTVARFGLPTWPA